MIRENYRPKTAEEKDVELFKEVKCGRKQLNGIETFPTVSTFFPSTAAFIKLPQTQRENHTKKNLSMIKAFSKRKKSFHRFFFRFVTSKTAKNCSKSKFRRHAVEKKEEDFFDIVIDVSRKKN